MNNQINELINRLFKILLYFSGDLARRDKRLIKKTITELEQLARDQAKEEQRKRDQEQNAPAPLQFAPVATSEDIAPLWRRVISNEDIFTAYSNILNREDKNKQLIYLGYYLAKTEQSAPGITSGARDQNKNEV